MRASRLAFLALVVLAGVVPILIQAAAQGSSAGRSVQHEIAWPATFEGRPLTQLPLTAVELRFAAQFPGQIGRFTDGRRTLIVRMVQEPTRLLHPASDCFRGLGYRTDPPRIVEDGGHLAWSCFMARKDGRAQRVCERIHDNEGRAWTDVSAWYWAAAFGRTPGPWTALTLAQGPVPGVSHSRNGRD